MKRVLVALILLACFILPLGGTFTVLMVRRQAVRREAKQKLISSLDRSELVRLKFTSSELRCVKIDAARKEFEKDGLMFDIVYSVQKSDTTIYWCWPDHQETDLNKRLDDLASKAFGVDKRSKRVQNDLVHFFALLFFEGKAPLLTDLVAEELSHPIQNILGIQITLSADTPPPRA